MTPSASASASAAKTADDVSGPGAQSQGLAQDLPQGSTQQSNLPVHSDDDESDLDDLDDVLDDFKPTAPAPATNAASQPAPAQTGPAEDFDEEAFMKQLEKDMACMMGEAAKEAGTTDTNLEDAVNQGADVFTKELEDSGIAPGDFLKQLLSSMAEGDGAAPSSAGAGAGAGGAGGGPPPESFNDAIQATINRMKESGDKATAAAEEDDSNDLVAQLMKAIEAGAGAGDDGDLTKMFMGMMEQLSNKEMLYEPMKELDTKFGPWLVENKGKDGHSAEEMERYEKQAGIVAQIVAKFEDKGYTDEDPKCREYVWERMQEMQAAGNPPEELIANPFGDEKGSGAGMPDCPQQ
ncbi:Pex19 protein family-domain-containing protein [Aspergillus avenaceus]|uniref:Pex19 protein family-domain-containing protein n=1 Tax=Aspergillus avenaceus TaxID=36643 RepID=A0A5N6U398_ASPAV|nr:Pex19 protein family-domain-containing protein [Aspergillus avenaceus]